MSRLPSSGLVVIAVVLCLVLSLGSVALARPLPSSMDAGVWQPVGPDGGSVIALAASPAFASDHTLFLVAEAGVYTSLDSGLSWQLASSAIQTASWQKAWLGFSPAFTTDHTVFLGNHETLYRSQDSGSTWVAIAEPGSPGRVQAVAISPAYGTDQTVFIGTELGVWVSANGGDTWRMTAQHRDTTVLAISPAFAGDQTLFSVNPHQGIFKTNNAGASWTQSGTGIPNGVINSILFSPAYASDQTLVAALDVGVYKTTTGGAAWGPTGLHTSAKSIAISPAFASDQTLYAITWRTPGYQDTVVRSTDGGATWQPTTYVPGSWLNAVAVSPSYSSDQTVLVAHNFLGIYLSPDAGTSWQARSSGLRHLNTVAIAASPNYAADQTIMATGPWEGLAYASSSGGNVWTQSQVSASDLQTWALAVSPNFAVDRTAFVATRSNATGGGGIYKSTDGGSTWQGSSSGVTCRYHMALAFSPAYAADQTAFVASCGVWRTRNGGGLWEPGGYGISGIVQAIAVSPAYTSDHWVFAGSGSGGVYRSTDGGRIFSPVFTAVPTSTINALAISPAFAGDRTIFAGTGSGVCKSTNGGASCTSVNNGLINLTITSLVISPHYATDQTIYAATAGGVFKSANGGSLWTPISSGLPVAQVDSLVLAHNSTNVPVLFAGIYGYSVWRYVDAPQPTATPSPTTTHTPTTTATHTPTATDTPTATPTPAPTETVTGTRTATLSATPTICPMATPEPLWVDPVTSPSGALSQMITVYIGNGEAVTVTLESGVFSVFGDFGATSNPAQVEIALLPNTTHHLLVEGRVREVIVNGCRFGGYVHSTRSDRFGNELVIVQHDATVTPMPTRTATATATATPQLPIYRLYWPVILASDTGRSCPAGLGVPQGGCCARSCRRRPGHPAINDRRYSNDVQWPGQQPHPAINDRRYSNDERCPRQRSHPAINDRRYNKTPSREGVFASFILHPVSCLHLRPGFLPHPLGIGD